MKLRLPYALIKALGCVFGVAVTTLGTSNSYGAGMHSQVSIVTYTDFGQNMGRYRVNGVNDLLSSIRREEGGVVITYLEGHDDYTMDTPMISFESQGDNGALAAIGYNYIATVQHNACQNPTFTGRYLDGDVSLRYYGTEYRDAITFCLVAQSEDQKHTQDYKVTRLNRLITDVTPSTPMPRFGDSDIVAQLKGRMEYRSGAGTMSLWTLDGTKLSRAGAYNFAIGGMRLIDNAYLNDKDCPSFFTTVATMDYSAAGVSQEDPLPFAPAGGDSGSPVWVWDAATESYLYLDAYQSIFGDGARSANARGDIDYTWDALEKFDANVGMSGNTVHIKGVTARSGDQVVTEDIMKDGKVDHTYTATLHKGSVQNESGQELASYVGVKGNNNERIDTWLNLAPEKDNANWFAYDNKYYNVGVYNNIQRELEIQNLFFTENLVFLASSASGNTVAVDADTDLGVGYVQFSIAPESGLDHADFTLQSNGRTSGGKDDAQRDFILNSAGFVVEQGVALHVKLTNTEWDSAANDYYYREWRKVGEGDLYLEGSGNNGIFLNVGGPGTTYLNETNGYAAYNVYAGSGATVVMDSTAQIARDFTFGYNGGTLDIRGNNSMDWYRTNPSVAAQGFSINSFSEDSYITNSQAGTTLTLTYREAGDTEYLGSFVDTEDGGAVRIHFAVGSGSATLHSIHTDLTHQKSGDYPSGSGVFVDSGTLVLSGTNTVHGRGSATGRNADRYFSAEDWHYADMAGDVFVGGNLDYDAEFELGSHARLTGNVYVYTGSTLTIREGVHSTYEYIEGGLRLEDTTTAFYRQFYGLHGNMDMDAATTLRFLYSHGTTAEQVYTGNITGGADVYMELGGSGATLRLSGTNTFSGSKSLSGGGLISDNGLAALGSVLYDTLAWHVAEDAFIAANNATGAQLLSLVKKDSTGVLALTQAQAADLNLQNMGYSGLIVGALEGMDVHYGTAGASLSTVQNGGKDRWLLGGGGGNLIVDFALQDGTAELVLGNEYTTGNVTLTNSSNEIGTISFMGQVTLSYTDEAALGGATVDLNYANRMQLLSSSGLGGISSTSAGVVLVDKLDGAALDMTAHPGLYIGAGTAKQLDAAPLIAPGAAYRFGGIDGTLTVNAVLANADSQPTGLFVDGQTFSGGVLELAQAATITGAVDVRGYDPARMLPTMVQKGDITLRLTAENAIASASSVTMEDGGIIDIYGTTQTLNNLGAEAGSLVTDSSLSGSGVLNLNNTTGTTFGGVLDVARVNKTGSGTLNLSGTSLVDAYNVQQGTLHVSAPAAISGVAYIQGGATLSLAAGDYGMVAALHDGANLRVADNATTTLGGLVLADNATANLSGGTLRVTDMETIIGNGATLNLTGASLALAIDEDLHFTNTLRASGGASSTVTVSGGNKDTSYTRVFDSISVDAGSTLTLEQGVQETAPAYEIHSLSGQGTFVISQGTYKDAPTFYKFNRDTEFAGTFKILANTGYSSHKYMSHTLIQSDNALANAQVQMQGWSSDSGYVTLGIDTENASIKGLETVINNRSILMAGVTAETTAQKAPVSTRRATLTITGSESKDFQGQVVGGADGTDNGLSIVMNGSGTQTFSGVSVFNDVSALKGTLRISNSNENTAIKGDLTVARGATLYISKAYTLGSGKTLHVVGKASANTAQLTVPLTFSGGTIDFSGDALNGSMAALHLSSSISGRATISFSETSLLQTGVTYKLADGNWSNITLTTASLDYLTARVSATSTGLTATFSLRDDSYIWNGNSTQHTWTTSTFGQQTLSFQSTYRAVFADAAASKDVQVNASISAASLIIDSTGEYTFGGSGKVTASTLSQLAAGTTNIGSSVKITGQAHVQAGTLAMFGGSSTGSVLVDEGATLVLKGVDATTGSVSGGGALVIDWEDQTGSIPAIGESGIGSLRVASGTLTTAAQLNVKNGTWVEQGATLRSTVGGILSSGQALHLAGNLELNLAAGSLTTSIAGYDGTRGSVLLNSTGTSTIAANTTMDADTLTVNTGSVSVDKAAVLNVDSLTVGSSATVQIHRDGNSVRNIGSVQLGASSTLSLYSDAEPSTAMNVDRLELHGADASVVQEYISGAILFRSLSRKGSTDVTLNLDSTAAYQKISVFELGGADDTPGDFSGEIILNCTSGSSYNRSSALLLDDANVAAGAVINLKSAKSPAAVLGFGVNAPVVNIAGLTSNSAIGARARLFSGSVAPSTMLSDEAFAGSDETHKLVITTASGSAYDFYGTIGRNVDLTVAGSGTQRLLGSGAAFSGMLTVQGGTLQIANAADFGSSSEKEGFNATLAGGTLALQGGGLNLGSGSLSVTGDTTISMDTAGEYSYRDGSDSENGFSLMTIVSSGSASHTAGSLTGQGVLAGKELIVMDNGVYALDSAHGRAYYVNTTVDYGPQAAGSAYANADSLVLNRDGAVLNMQTGLSDTAAANGIKAQVAGGQVNLAQGVTLHQNTITDTENVKIGGAGTYQVQVKTGTSNIDTTLGAANKVTLADGWTGTVELLGAGGFRSHLVLENYGNSLSSVRLTGNAGWLSSNETFAVNLLLEDAENQSALTIVNGGSGGTETFNGSISGSGTMEMAWDSNLDFKFNGDLSGWTGGFKTTAGTANVHLLAGVTDVAAAIQATSLTVGESASAGANVTFLNTVRAASFTAHGSVTVGDSGTLDLTALTSAATLDALTLGTGSTTVLNQTSMLTATGILAVENGATLDLTGLSVSGAPQSYVLATGGNVTLGESVSFTLADETLLGRASLGVVNGTSLVLTLAPATQNLVWQGPNGQWTTDAAQMPWYAEGTQTAASFRNGDSVRFGSASNTHTATLGADINAAALAVNENAAVTLALNSHALTTETLTVDSGSSLTVSGSGKVMEAAASAIGGAVVLGAGTTLKLNGAESSFTLGRVSLYNGAKLDVAAADSVTAESVFVDDGCAAEISLAQDMAVTAGVSADTKAGALYTMGATKTLSIHSADAGSIKTLTVDKLDIANHNTAVSLQNVVLNVQGAATVGVLVTDRSNDDGIMTVGGGAVLNFNGSVDWHKAGSSDVVNLTVQSGGAAHVNNGAANTLNNITVQDGGTLSFAAGTTTALYGAISLEEQIANGGTLDFGGRNVAIALGGDGAATTFAITPEGYTGIAGEESLNGFHHTMAGDITSGSGSVANGGSVAITFNGATVTGLNADGTFGTVDRTTYHVRSGAVNYSDIASAPEITAVKLAGGTLNLNAPLAASVTRGIQSQGGSVNIGSGITLQASFLSATAATTLAGSGVYAISYTNASPSLGSNVSLGEGWHGVLRFSGGGSSVNILLNTLAGHAVSGATAYSTVEFDGASGYFQGGGTNTFASDIVLAADHDNRSAMDVSNGNSNAEYTFSGKVSGSGSFERSATGPGNLTFIFTGDVSEWNGLFKQTSSKSTTYVKFVDNPLSAGASTVDIAAGVSNVGSGNMELTYDNDHAVQVLGNISRTGTGTLNMTVAAGTDASFTGNVTGVSSLTLSGTASFSGTNALTNVTVEDGASLRIAGGTTSISGSVSLAEQVQNAGVVDFGGNALTVSLASDASAFGITLEGYTSIDGVEGDNGFHHGVRGSVIEGDGTIAGSGHVTVSYNGAAYALNADGTFGMVDNTTYHVRKGSVDYGTELAGTASITSVALYEDATLNLNTALAANVGIASTGGTVNIGNAVTLQAASLTANAATTLAGGGTYALANAYGMPANVQLSGNAWSGTVRFTGASSALDLAGAWVGSGTAASTVEFRDWSGSFAGNSATIGARVQLSGGTAMTLSSAVETTVAFTNGVGGSADIAHSGAGRLNLSFSGGDIAWMGSFVNADGTADITYSNIGSVANSIFAMDGSVNVHLNNVGTYHGGISNASLHVSGTTAFNGSGYLTSLGIAQNANFSVGGSTTVMGNVDAGGILAVAGGATLSIQGSITRLAAQIANNGTLDFGGRSAGISLTGDGSAFHIKEAGYTNIAGEEDENGFSHSLMGDLASGSGNIANGGNVTITFGSSSFTGLNADGTFGTVDNTTYHVRSGVVDYGSDMAGVASITTVAVSNNAALNVNTALAANVGITSSGGSLNIAENVTVDHSSIQASAPTTLGGKGRLVLANNSIAMPDNVTLGADWEGVVAVSGLSQSGTFTPAPLANENSWIEIKGLSGYLSTAGNSTYVVSSNLVLAGDADGWAFKQNNGYGGSTVSFTGAIKGSGNLGRSVGTGSTYTYEFSGDISGWNGQFISTNNNNCYTMFRVKGDATLVNAELVQSNSTASNKDFRVEVQNHATFTKSLSADKLAVTSGGEATFTGESVQFKDVTLNIDAGLVVSSATSARFTGNVDLYEAITNNGILTIDSLSSIDHLAVSEDSLYRDGNDSRNGFLYAERVQVVNMGENAQLTVTTKPTTYNGKAGTLDTNTGVFSVTEASESYDTFYVNKAGTTESLANAIQKSYSTVESIRMAGGTTLDASNVMEGAVLDNLILREHGDAAPATITGGTAAFRNLVMEGAVSSVSVDDGAKLKVDNVIEVAANRTLATSGGGTFEATTVRSTGGVVRFSGDTLVSGGGSGQGGVDNKLGLAITGNGGTIALNGGTTIVTGAVYTNAQNTAIEVGGGEQAATLVATRMELGDNGSGAGTLTVGDNGKVVVTGGVNGRGTSNLKNDSLVLGEWSQAYTTNVQGSLYARDAIAMLGKDAVQSVNVQGGTMAVKGVWSITDDGEKNHNLSVTDGGRLILGESGIVAENGSWNIDVTDSEIGLYADTSIGRAVNLHGKVVVNTDKYEFKGTGAAQEVVQGVSAGKMTVSGAVNADASATLSKAGSGTLEISGSTAGFHGSVEVQGGILDIMNAASVDMQDVTIGSNGTLGVYKGETKAHETNSEGTIVIHDTKTLTAGRDAALNANLVMEGGSTLDVRGTGGAGLLMGSEVTLSTGMTLSDYSGDWTSWEVGTKYVLFTGVDGLDIGNGVTTGTMDYTQWVDAKEYFENIQESNRYFLCYGGAPDQNAVGVLTSVNDGSNVGMVYIMAMPEPTTSTLSLLALAALAARRRRK